MLEPKFLPLTSAHMRGIKVQPSQAMLLGQPYSPDDAQIDHLCAGPIAWAAMADDRVLACFGVAEQFIGAQGLGWAILASGIGAAHLPITRFARMAMAGCTLPRVELLARCHDVEGVLARFPDMDPGQIVALLAENPTPEIRWAMMLGFAPAHVLRCFGAASETVMLMERIAPHFRACALREAA